MVKYLSELNGLTIEYGKYDTANISSYLTSMNLKIPETMYAWRKHRGNKSPVSRILRALCFASIADLIHEQVWEEVPVPEPPPNGVLCKMLASGGVFECMRGSHH